MDEKTTFNLKEDGKAWWIPAYKENRYEYLYQNSAVSSLDTVVGEWTRLILKLKDSGVICIEWQYS